MKEQNIDIYNIQDAITQLAIKNEKEIKLINNNDYSAIKLLEEITCILSNINYLNLYNFYSKNISKSQFFKNN